MLLFPFIKCSDINLFFQSNDKKDVHDKTSSLKKIVITINAVEIWGSNCDKVQSRGDLGEQSLE